MITIDYVSTSRICMLVFYLMVFFFFFKQKTAYEMRISDWSSDVCSSDLDHRRGQGGIHVGDHEGAPVAHPLEQRILGVTVEAVLEHECRVDEIGRASCRERVCQYV